MTTPPPSLSRVCEEFTLWSERKIRASEISSGGGGLGKYPITSLAVPGSKSCRPETCLSQAVTIAQLHAGGIKSHG